ncbi:MAG: alcohol dehydrogenase catalytic domain-containing protein [Planctomycetota bacterium]
MRAVVLGESGVRFRPDQPDPIPQPTEILVRPILAGICETDLQLVRGYMGFRGILGHEFVGIAQSGRHAGKRVVAEINCSCHACDTCLGGRANHCPHRTVLGIDRHDGAFADAMTVPERNLHLVPDVLVDEAAVLTEPLAAAFQIPDQIDIHPDMEIVVLGDGRLGLFCAMVLHSMRAKVHVLGKHTEKLQRFHVRGIHTQQLSSTEPESVPSNTADLVVDCTGSASGLPMAMRLVRPRGTVVLKTTVADNHSLNLASIVIDEISVIGSRCGPFDKALHALANDTIDVRDLITHRFTLSETQAAFTAARAPSSFKVVFEC